MDFSKYEPHGESPIGTSVTSTPMSTSSEIVHFLDSNPAQTYAVDSEPDASFSIAHTDDANLEKFFARPLIVLVDTWNQSVNYYQSFDPWSAFFNDKKVINRIANYNLVRAKLHVKAIINGNSFFYGRLLMNYAPFSFADQFTRDRGLIAQDNIEASQRPHVYLDPTFNQGGQLDLPFYYTQNALNVPFGTWNQMGTVSIRTLAPLAHANGATDSVKITYLVWATDVELSVPTSANPASITPQMAVDEYGVGPISKPASVVAQVAGMLKKAPVIGPYARATELGANALAKIAGVFGYSRPTCAKEMTEVRLCYGGNMASCNLPDTSHKLTLDCKNEVTIDPRVVGLSGVDEMDIRSIATRESYLTNFPWQLSDTTSKLLFASYVTPIQYDLYTSATPYEVHMSPSTLAAMPFMYWRGSMRFRFQIVASSFHKGRLAIVYDPHFGKSTMPAFNTSYTYIVDIAESRDFTMTVGWGNTKPYLYTTNGAFPGATSATNFSTVGVLPAGPRNDATNGVVSVYVLNDLTTPNTTVTNTVQVNVFTSMCDDFEVGVPTSDAIQNYSHFAYQSLIEPHSGVDVESETIDPIDGTVGVEVAKMIPETDYGSAIFFGESIRSIRQLFKRYQFQRHYAPAGATTGQNLWNFTIPAIPQFRGFSTAFNWAGETNTSKIATGQKPYSYNKMTFLSWFMPSYVSFRGSLRHKLALSSPTVQAPGYFLAGRANYATPDGIVITTPSVGTFWVISDFTPNTCNGADLQVIPQHGIVEVESPYYSSDRFKLTRSPYGSSAERLQITFLATNSATIADYVAAGEDFSLQFFTNASIMFYTGKNNTSLL